MSELPREERLRWLLEKSAALHAGGAEPVSGLVLPDGAFFPDDFDGSARAVKKLLGRVVRHAGLSDVRIRLDVPVEEEGVLTGGGGSGTSGKGSCSTGGCATPAPQHRAQRVTARKGGYTVTMLPEELRSPMVLTVTLARAVAHVFMKEADLYEAFGGGRAQAEAAIDLAGTLLGFGVLLCNGAYIYSKGCGGVHVGTATALPVEEIAVALAIYCRLHGAPPRTAGKHLDATPRAYFDEAVTWVESNARTVDLIKSDPRAVEGGSYSLSEGRSWVSRLFGIGRGKGPQAPTDDDLASIARDLSASPRERSRPLSTAQDEERARRLAALRELVDESFD